MDTITIVYAEHWEVVDEYCEEDPLYRSKTIHSDSKIRKIFYKLDDAINYINSVPNQLWPPDYYELLRNPQNEQYDDLKGFFLYQKQYHIE